MTFLVLWRVGCPMANMILPRWNWLRRLMGGNQQVFFSN